MNQRDQAILNDLQKFRVMERDHIAQLHFSENKDGKQSCNKVMKRLTRDGFVDVDHSRRPYQYFPAPCPFKKNSTKIPHYKEIVDFYIDLSRIIKPSKFEVEFRTTGNLVPDIYMTWSNASFFVEIQRNIYTKKVMEAKVERYRQYYLGGEWKEYSKHFPLIWFITEHTYKIDFDPLRVYQTKNVEEMIERHMTRK
ncbi:replication-relaxation family protein [Metabacillus sp. GX 13764]|uniref:replication-relaxation family protein n=1 Tax=Metabacillus kandeliae TaxID=2900151 RepID=UPI001E422286|nr:replication-relaxation family protein [Metabacillus kandeliae]MCD7034298.1 replication-relaxation family protein [Metabacillus kandeliae]